MRWLSFTLVELLVVIAAMAFLVGILVPSLRNARQHAKATLCGSNMKQLVLGLTMYEAETETFPHTFDSTRMESPPGGYPGASAYDRMGWWWFNHITDYSQKEPGRTSVTWCPSRQIKIARLKDNVLCGNYGVNQSICKSSSGRENHAEFIGVPLRSVDISHPSQTLLVVDSGYSMINWWHVTDSPPVVLGNTVIEDTAYIPGLWINKKRALWPGQEDDAINGRHPNKTVNVGFADGHVSRKKADDLCVEKTNDGYKNLCPLWLPK
jgi:prepilin-type processing-associated H-X9-DG protein